MGKKSNYDGTDKKHFGARLTELMKKDGINDNALAAEIGVDRSSICRYRIGDAIPGSEKVERIAKYFKVESRYFFVDTESENKKPLPSGLVKALVDFSEIVDNNYKIVMKNYK